MKSCHEYGKQETIIHTLTWSVLFTKNIIFACLMFIQRMYMSNYEPQAIMLQPWPTNIMKSHILHHLISFLKKTMTSAHHCVRME